MKKGEFDLYICNFLPESLFWQNFGKNAYYSAIQKVANKGICSACGHEPQYTNSNQCLQHHIYNINQKNPENSESTILCQACHTTQHIASAIEKGYVKFVNSTLSQATLVAACRYGDLRKLYANSKLFDLKKTPEQILKEIKSGTFKPSTTLKVVFTDKFSFNDL